MPDRIDPNSFGDAMIQLLTHPLAMLASAFSGLTSPWWLPDLSDAHDTAALWLPILGCIVAGLQIIAFIVKAIRDIGE